MDSPQSKSEIGWLVELPLSPAGLHPNSASAAAYPSRCQGPIGEASSGEIILDDEVLDLGGSVAEGRGLR